MRTHYKFPLVRAALLFACVFSILPFAAGIAHASPLTISSCNDLEKIASSSYPTYTTSASYVLTQNIDCSITATQNPIGGGVYNGFTPIPDFTGTFDGAGHTISNLYINTTGTNVGLFSILDGSSVVQNLNLTGGSVTGNTEVGAVAGSMIATATISNVTSSVPVTSTTYVGGLVGLGSGPGPSIASSTSSGTVISSGTSTYIGGLAGAFGGTISTSSSSGSLITGNNVSSVGGLVGTLHSTGQITGSHSSESIQIAGKGDYVGGIVGENDHTLSGSYFSGTINASTTVGVSSNIGGVVGYDGSAGGVTNSFYNVDTVTIMGAHAETPYGIYTSQYNAWTAGNYTPLVFSTYFPSTDTNGYYDITSLADLKNLLGFVETDLSAKKIKITAPIALPAEFYIPRMNALEFNGGSNAITGLSINRLNWGFNEAFIGDAVGSTTITNLTLVNASVISNTAGGLVNVLDGTLSNSTISGTVSGTYEVGGAVAEMDHAYDTISNVQSSASVTGVTDANGARAFYIGGIAGYENGLITNSSASGAVSLSVNNGGYIGGLIGYADTSSVTQNSYASSPISTSGSANFDVGGLIGYGAGVVSNSYATGAVTASGVYSAAVGGLIGENANNVTNSYATGSVTANASQAQQLGGLIGENDSGSIASTSASGAVTATGFDSGSLGGLIGLSYGAISNSFATGNVTGGSTSLSIGGLDGLVDSGSITECYATGNVVGNSELAGLAGLNYGTISKSFATGSATVLGASAEYIGGFAGLNQGPIQDAYATGGISIDITASSTVGYFGGFVGENDSPLANVYSTGSITGSVYLPTAGHDGGFVGENTSTITNSYGTGAGPVIAAISAGPRTSGYLIGHTQVSTLVNLAQYSQGTPAIGYNQMTSTSSPFLATNGYGTDESTLSNFYVMTEPVYAQASTTAWDFTTIWETHPTTFPTFQWYSPATPTYTITASAGTGGIISYVGALSVLGGTSQSYNIITNSGYTIANVLVDGVSVGAVSTYTFSNINANHTISVTFTAPAVSSGGGSFSGGSVPNQVSNLLQQGKATAAATLEQQFPNLFTSGTTAAGSTGAGVSSGTPTASTFTRALTLGMTGSDVLALQKYLNAHGYVIAKTGAGSLGNETTYFGKATRAALAAFQKAKGISPAAGYFGSITRAYIAQHS